MLYVPAAHPGQPTAPATGEYVPAAHDVQTEAPLAEAYAATGQFLQAVA